MTSIKQIEDTTNVMILCSLIIRINIIKSSIVPKPSIDLTHSLAKFQSHFLQK